MPVVYNAVDNEFAVSTGSNVDTTANSSTFDNPPNGSKDLVVTSNDGDAHPGLFELGETYDVQWGGQGGGGLIEEAVVVRSDEAPGGGGVIVFEGTDENGDSAQVIWTPGFDLEGWYNSNYNPSMEPQFYTEDQQSNYSHQINCFGAGTYVRTSRGHIPAKHVQSGDLVLTWSGTWSEVLLVRQRIEPGIGKGAPVVFPPDVIGNRRTLILSQQHRILLTHSLLDLHFGSSAMLVPALAFIGLAGVTTNRQLSIHYVHLALLTHEAIMAEGAWCESLYAKQPIALQKSAQVLHHSQTVVPTLSASEARMMLPMIFGKSTQRSLSRKSYLREVAVC